MKKLIAVLCVVAMMAMAVPALANPSASSTVTILTPGIIVTVIEITTIEHADVKTVVEAVNGEGQMTPAQVVAALLGPDAPEMALATGYSFTSQFNTIDAEAFPVDIEIAGADMNTRVMLINPSTGELVIIEANPDGTFTIPFAGIFAVMDPTPA